MDLPVCPSCGQSVLDENPELCPFCGSSMKAKPGQKPPAAPKSAPPKKPAAPVAVSSGSSGKPAGSTPAKPAPDKDDPFAFKSESQETSIRVALKQAPGRTYAVTCPMCEMSGFIPETAAGKFVRCANPSCMVPVFEAPVMKPKEAPAPPPKKKLSPVALIGLVGLVGVIGFNVWYFVIRTPVELPSVDLKPIADNPAFPKDNPGANNPDQPGSNGPGKVEPAPVKQVDQIAFRDKLMDEYMLDIAQSADWNSKRNRSLSYSRQVLLESYARVGFTQKALDQLQYIDRQNPELAYDRLPVYIEVLWKKLAAGEEIQAELTQAVETAKKTPSVGRNRFDRLNALAAILFAVGQKNEAREWSRKSWSEANISTDDQLSRIRMASSHLRIFRDLPGYTFSTDIENPLTEWEVPESVTVTLLLAGHGKKEAATEWIAGAANDRVKSDCLLAWIRWGLTTGNLTLAEVESLIAPQPKLTQARALAFTSILLRRDQKLTEADRLLASAVDAGQTAPRTDYILPEPSQLLTQTLGLESALLHEILMLATVADAQRLAGKNQESWQTMERALTAARSFSPSPVALAAQPRKQDDPSGAKVVDQLKAALKLTDSNAIRIQFNKFTAKLTELDTLVAQRQSLVEALLSAANDWELSLDVWDQMSRRIDSPDPNIKEPFLQSALLARVQARLTALNQKEALAEISLRLGQLTLPTDRFVEFEQGLAAMLASGDFKPLAPLLQKLNLERNRLEVAVLPHVLQLSRERKYQAAAALIDAMSSQKLIIIREELYFFLGREAGRNLDGPNLQALVKNLQPTATEELNLWGGVVQGIPPKPSSSAAASSGEKVSQN